MFAGITSAFQSMLAQPALLAMGAGVLAGAITGTTLVVTGILPGRPDPELSILSCYQDGREIASGRTGVSMLLTARSPDGTWLEMYIGAPGAERGWAPASALKVGTSTDSLPVHECVGFIPFGTLGPPASPGSTEAPSAAPSAVPTILATVAPTFSLAPGATPSPTPRPTATPRRTAKPSATPLPPPPTILPTPTPAPSTDVFPPSVLAPFIVSPGAGTGGNYYLGHLPCSPPTATVRVAANDPSGLNWVRLWYARPAGGGSAYLTMYAVGSGVYEQVIAPDNTWQDGEIGLWAQAQDTNGTTSGLIPFGNPSNPGDVSLFWSAFCIT